MKVTFEIEIDDALVHQLDYYENFAVSAYGDAGCKKCVFYPMCHAFSENIFDTIERSKVECKFPCWANKSDRLHGIDRKVFVLKPSTKKK